jgi:predicted aspartyl protease
MKNLIFIIISLIEFNLAFAQNVTECEKIVLQTYEAINQKNDALLIKHLSDDFTIAGHTGEVARMILPQLFVQLNMKVTNIKKVSEVKTDVLTLVFEAEFAEIGVKQSTFVFNEKNQLKELELLPMQVMTKEGDATIKKNDQAYFTVPFKRVGKLISVQVKLNGIFRTFIIDTGAPVFVLNSAHIAKDTAVKKLTLADAQGVGGTISEMAMEHIESFEFGGIYMDTQNVISMDLSHLEKATKTTLFGLLGYEIYKDYDMLFDYKKKTVTFLKPEATKDFLESNYKINKQVEVPIEMGSHLAIVKGKINGKEYTFGFDSGAESSVFDIRLKDELKPSFSRLKKDSMLGADKNVVDIYLGKLDSLVIGDVVFKKTETSFSDISHLNNGYKLKLDGLIGFDILSNQATLISYTNRKVIFLR